ncbi:GIY-YIG nuclease family protein [Paraglaciecola agarilytica]|uniref:GIY-YIG nuclease family protein n=1 Tax=Paraglaciecola chathamensis TaxID=368405 RepID=UPI001C094580|nr:GIY-YIG nuclease family protein [Paraglaciecola agarilytica]MBU3020164.1 GIY-YIG nuclease family protein [Paraglaciecola agarilytica]
MGRISIKHKAYFDSINVTKVDKPLFFQRCNRLLLRCELNDELLWDAATLEPKAYLKKYSTRRTLSVINGESVDLQNVYRQFERPLTHYTVFRERLNTFSKKQQKMSLADDMDVLSKAAYLSKDRWNYFIGGGRAKPFVYRGAKYPQIRHKQFLSVPSLLMELGLLDIKPLVLGRLKQGFNIDRAILQEKYAPKDGYGTVYKLVSSISEREYVGLTTLKVSERLEQHKSSALNGSKSLIHKEMRRHGVETFRIEIVESKVPISELPEREKHYIRILKTLSPLGFNRSSGGQLGGFNGKPTIVNGQNYTSITNAAKDIENQTNGVIRYFSVESCIRNGKDIPDITNPPRKNSTHKDAGNNLFRRHSSLLKRNRLSHEWIDYDTFKRDVLLVISLKEIAKKKLRLTKISNKKAFGPFNFSWVTAKKANEVRCGKVITAFGKDFPSMTALAKHYGMPVSTLKYRIRVLKLVTEQAIQT